MWLEDSEVLEEDDAEVLYKLKEAVGGEVVLIKAALYPRVLACVYLIACLLLLDLGLELLLEDIRRLIGYACEEVVTSRGREASDNADKLL